MKVRSKIWIVIALLIVAAQAVVTFGISHKAIVHLPFQISVSGAFLQSVFGDITQAIIVLFGGLVMLANAIRRRGPERVFWILFAVGMGLWFTNLSIWAYYEVLARVTVPEITLGDTFLFLHLVPMVAALGVHPERRANPLGRQRAWLDFAVLLTFWLYVYALLVMPYEFVNPDLPNYNFNFDVIDKIGHWVLVLGLAITWLRTRGPWRQTYLLFTLATLAYALFSDFANLAVDQNTYYTGSPYDIVLIATMCFFSYAALVGRWKASDHDVPVQAELPKRAIEWPAVVGMAAILSTPAIGLYLVNYSQNMKPEVRDFRIVITLIAMVLLVFLVFLKQSLLQKDLVDSLTTVSEAYIDLKQVKNELVRSEKLASMGRLLAGAAHEINNPLTAILGYSDLMGSDEGIDPLARTMADKIGQQARRTKMLVEDLLKFSQETPTQRSVNDVQVLVDNAVKIAGLESGNNAIKVEVSTSEKLPPVMVDSGQILNVFVHLIRNAADAMRESETRVLRISTRGGSSQIQVEFADSGSGVKDPELVFDPFYTTKSPGKGTGLGLSACYGIVQKHGGQITCQNRPQGGAIFTVTLPAAQQNEMQSA